MAELIQQIVLILISVKLQSLKCHLSKSKSLSSFVFSYRERATTEREREKLARHRSATHAGSRYAQVTSALNNGRKLWCSQSTRAAQRRRNALRARVRTEDGWTDGRTQVSSAQNPASDKTRVSPLKSQEPDAFLEVYVLQLASTQLRRRSGTGHRLSPEGNTWQI